MLQLDWEEARRICEENNGYIVDAGLEEDWRWTSGTIFDGEKYVENDDVFVASTWKTPIVRVHKGDEWEKIPCFKEGSDPDMPGWWA